MAQSLSPDASRDAERAAGGILLLLGAFGVSAQTDPARPGTPPGRPRDTDRAA